MNHRPSINNYCPDCLHYRPQASFVDAYKEFDRAPPREPLMKSLLDLRKEETRVQENEMELQLELLMTEQVSWPTRPRFAPRVCMTRARQFPRQGTPTANARLRGRPEPAGPRLPNLPVHCATGNQGGRPSADANRCGGVPGNGLSSPDQQRARRRRRNGAGAGDRAELQRRRLPAGRVLPADLRRPPLRGPARHRAVLQSAQ